MNEINFYMEFLSNLHRRAPVLFPAYFLLSLATWVAPPFVAAYWREWSVDKYLWSNMCFCLVPIWTAATAVVCFFGMKGIGEKK